MICAFIIKTAGGVGKSEFWNWLAVLISAPSPQPPSPLLEKIPNQIPSKSKSVFYPQVGEGAGFLVTFYPRDKVFQLFIVFSACFVCDQQIQHPQTRPPGTFSVRKTCGFLPDSRAVEAVH
jgi:hypothetical protein